MKWPILFGRNRDQPATGRWHKWKQVIADFCEGKCIYCAISEARFGGIRNFHIEHFRPKVRFPLLENDIGNLYLACAICNVLKCDDWPDEPAADHSRTAYPDPSLVDYNALFSVSTATYEVAAQSVAGTYVIERMSLNRAQLIVERRFNAIQAAIDEFDAWVRESLDALTPAERKETIRILLDINKARNSATAARPYEDADTKRPKRSKGRKRRSSSQ